MCDTGHKCIVINFQAVIKEREAKELRDRLAKLYHLSDCLYDSEVVDETSNVS